MKRKSLLYRKLLSRYENRTRLSKQKGLQIGDLFYYIFMGTEGLEHPSRFTGHLYQLSYTSKYPSVILNPSRI